jgi:NTP pyrophosphatase (non-canonical NTP hydrolase)
MEKQEFAQMMEAMLAETLEKKEANRKTDIKEIKEEMKANWGLCKLS